MSCELLRQIVETKELRTTAHHIFDSESGGYLYTLDVTRSCQSWLYYSRTSMSETMSALEYMEHIDDFVTDVDTYV